MIHHLTQGIKLDQSKQRRENEIETALAVRQKLKDWKSISGPREGGKGDSGERKSKKSDITCFKRRRGRVGARKLVTRRRIRRATPTMTNTHLR